MFENDIEKELWASLVVARLRLEECGLTQLVFN
jgi:hypothetical protein